MYYFLALQQDLPGVNSLQAAKKGVYFKQKSTRGREDYGRLSGTEDIWRLGKS
jgi:hypothetical protein